MDCQMKMTDALIEHKKKEKKNMNYQKEHMDLRELTRSEIVCEIGT